MLDIDALRKKLYDGENLTVDESKALISELAHFRSATAYLASCHAATAEGLPKSTSKSTLVRYAELCRISKRVLEGDAGGIRYPESMESAKKRCSDAVQELEGILQTKQKS